MFNFQASKMAPRDNSEVAVSLVRAWSVMVRKKEALRGAFVLDGAALTDSDIGDPESLLPLFAWHADNLYKYSINPIGLGLGFRTNSEAMLGRSVNFERVNRSTSELLCFLLEALDDAWRHLPKHASVKGATELRSLVNQFTESFAIAPAAQAILAPAAGQSRPQA